jgi:cytochrome oxidase Cu insertion factor (SCO1/SenC/PrrC family)
MSRQRLLMADTLKSNFRDFVQWSLFGFLAALIAIFILGRKNQKERTPSNQPVIKPLSMDTGSELKVISQVQPFTLTNQMGESFNLNELVGTPWLSNIIFTRCPTVCPKITQTIADLLPKLPRSLNFVTLTTDPVHDTPEVLKKFAQLNRAETNRWHFLTGDKPTLMRLAVDDLKMVSQPKPKAHQESPNDLFIHSSLLILVDKNGQVRASFESDAPNLADQIKKALTQLAP